MGSTSIARLDKASDTHVERKQGAGKWLRSLLRVGELLRRRGDEQRAQIRSAECAAGRPLQRQLDDAVYAPVRRVARDAAAVVFGIPQETFGVDRGAIGHRGCAKLGEHVAPPNRVAVA